MYILSNYIKKIAEEIIYRESFDLKGLLKKVTNIGVAKKIFQSFVNKIGKNKVLEIFDKVIREKEKETVQAADSNLIRMFAYPLLVAATIFVFLLGPKAVSEARSDVNSMKEKGLVEKVKERTEDINKYIEGEF